MFFFHCFWIFLGRDPSCCDVWLVSVGRGGALQVSCILFEIFCISCSSIVHDVCHLLVFDRSFNNVFVSSFICSLFSS